MLKVIYEDNHLLVVEKPVNMPVQADASGDSDLLSEAKKYIKEKYNKPGEVYLGLVHRLDRPVGGVMVFARTSKAAARLTDAMKARRTKKRYAAIVTAETESYASLENYIIKDEKTFSARLISENTPGAQRASLDYVLVSKKDERSLLDIALHTGRHHQIRAQLAGIGAPIWGDQRYNRDAKPGQQIALWAYSLTVEHPTLKEDMTFTSVPSGAGWESFRDELSALSCGIRCPYVDENIIVVNKTPDISCTVKDGGDDTVEARLIAAFGEVYPIHRIDAPTSGLVLFARNEQACAELTEAMADRRIRKLYNAIVVGSPKKDEDMLVLYQVKDANVAKVFVYDEKTENSKQMKSGYRLVSSKKTADGQTLSLLEVEIFTGRTHQIRASLSHIGCPVLGDDKYGDRRVNKAYSSHLRLCAVKTIFPSGFKKLKNLDGRVFSIEPPFSLDDGAAFKKV